MMGDVDHMRERGIWLILMSGWITVVAIALVAATLDETGYWPALVGAGLNSALSVLVLRGVSRPYVHLATGFVVASLPLLLAFALGGTPYQTDAHLYLLLALGMLTLLWDTRPVVVACSVILFHHLALNLLAPERTFEGDGGFELVVIHSIAVILCGALVCWKAVGFGDLFRRLEAQRTLSDEQAATLEKKAKELSAALEQVEKERALNIETMERIQEIRKSEYDKVAADFEQSVAAVTHSIATTAKLLRISAHQLKLNSDAAGEEAREVLGSAEVASKAANTVAAGIAELSLSIAEVAVHAGQQSQLSHEATERSNSGGQAIGSLSAQTKTIGEATRSIVRIAERTNLLSLNAAIEAASAGPSGRGFSIVAQEVKQLAAQASEAATRIESFLSGVRFGTIEAERSFQAIDSAIGEMGMTSEAICYDVENQRQSADTIENFARRAAGDTDLMVKRSRALAERAAAARDLSNELDRAAEALADSVRDLETSSQNFTSRLKVA